MDEVRDEVQLVGKELDEHEWLWLGLEASGEAGRVEVHNHVLIHRLGVPNVEWAKHVGPARCGGKSEEEPHRRRGGHGSQWGQMSRLRR